MSPTVRTVVPAAITSPGSADFDEHDAVDGRHGHGIAELRFDDRNIRRRAAMSARACLEFLFAALQLQALRPRPGAATPSPGASCARAAAIVSLRGLPSPARACSSAWPERGCGGIAARTELVEIGGRDVLVLAQRLGALPVLVSPLELDRARSAAATACCLFFVARAR